VIFFDPFWHPLNASALPTLEPTMENKERREHYRQLNQNQQEGTYRKGHRSSLPSSMGYVLPSLAWAIQKRIIALIKAQRSSQLEDIYGCLGVTCRQPTS
jgi:hypothetical protein